MFLSVMRTKCCTSKFIGFFSVWFLLLIRDVFSQNVHFEINCYFPLIFSTQCVGTAPVNIKSLKYPQPSSQLKEHLPCSKTFSRHIFSFFFSLFFELFETLVLIIFNCQLLNFVHINVFGPYCFWWTIFQNMQIKIYWFSVRFTNGELFVVSSFQSDYNDLKAV